MRGGIAGKQPVEGVLSDDVGYLSEVMKCWQSRIYTGLNNMIPGIAFSSASTA